MLIIGLHNDIDAGLCLIKDGRILEAVGEERFRRVKLYQGLPEMALKYTLEKHGLTVEDVDVFAYGWSQPRFNCRVYAEKLAQRIVGALADDPGCGPIITDRLQVENQRDGATAQAFRDWMAELKAPAGKIFYVDHHLSHAWSAFATSPFDNALVISLDGRGDLKSAGVYLADRDNGVEMVDYQLTFDSLGYLYGKVTAYLGYKPHRHEGKVTGLAAYGDPQKTLPLFRRLISFEDGRITAHLGRYKPFYSIKSWLKDAFSEYSREDIAAGVQAHTEDLALAFISHWRETLGKTGPLDICLAGGIFANVRLNQKIAELPDITGMYIHPNMGDGGIVTGSACAALYEHSGQAKVEMPTVLTGPEYNASQVEAALSPHAHELAWEELPDKVPSVAQDLAAEKVVGFFDGRMEYGPRALGARSIMYHTRDQSVNDWLNERLDRTEFMPFAPVTPLEMAGECYVGWQPDHVAARFMTRTYDCTPEFAAKHPAVVHVDGTARPQVVDAANDGDYYRVVKAYCEKTGERALINTSFNRHEEPIVCAPGDAISGLLAGLIDVLYLNNHRVTLKG